MDILIENNEYSLKRILNKIKKSLNLMIYFFKLTEKSQTYLMRKQLQEKLCDL